MDPDSIDRMNKATEAALCWYQELQCTLIIPPVTLLSTTIEYPDWPDELPEDARL